MGTQFRKNLRAARCCGSCEHSEWDEQAGAEKPAATLLCYWSDAVPVFDTDICSHFTFPGNTAPQKRNQAAKAPEDESDVD